MIRFVLVNDRMPRDDAYCTLCCEKIRETYVRDIQTCLFYCDHRCFGGHIKMTTLALKHHTRLVSRVEATTAPANSASSSNATDA
jgi:hypothetical protein